MRDSQPVSSSRRRRPQLRISAHLASSPKVTKVVSGSRPIRADRPGTLRGEQLRDRQARPGRRLARVTVCARRAHWYYSPKRCLPLMSGALGASHSARISRCGKTASPFTADVGPTLRRCYAQ
jgi:hypothetical protein